MTQCEGLACKNEAVYQMFTYHGGVISKWLPSKKMCKEHAKRFESIFTFLPVKKERL